MIGSPENPFRILTGSHESSGIQQLPAGRFARFLIVARNNRRSIVKIIDTWQSTDSNVRR